MTLLGFLKSNIQLDDEELKLIDSSFKSLKKAKGSTVIESGTSPNKIYFLESGLARMYRSQYDREITQGFFLENNFVFSLATILYGQPSPYTVNLLEDGVIRSIEYPDLESYLEQYSAAEKLMRFFLISALKTKDERINSLQFTSAQERYDYMLKHYPGLILRAPLGYIASYLGITQQTLSVIRARK